MENDLIYLKQRKVMGNKFGKVDHSCQLLEEYKCQILKFNFKKNYQSIYHLSLIFYLSARSCKAELYLGTLFFKSLFDYRRRWPEVSAAV